MLLAKLREYEGRNAETLNNQQAGIDFTIKTHSKYMEFCA
jgi:hypothetical protein